MAKTRKPQSAASKAIKRLNEQFKQISKYEDAQYGTHADSVYIRIDRFSHELAQELKKKVNADGTTYYAVPNNKKWQDPVIQKALQQIFGKDKTAGERYNEARTQAKQNGVTVKEQIEQNKRVQRVSGKSESIRYNANVITFFDKKYGGKGAGADYTKKSAEELKELEKDLDAAERGELVTDNVTDDSVTGAFNRIYNT